MAKRYKLSNTYWDQEKKDLKQIEAALEDMEKLDQEIVDAFAYVEQQNIYGELNVPQVDSCKGEIDSIQADVQDLKNYANWIQEDMGWREWEFATEFSKAIENLSKLDLEHYTTTNTLNVQETITYNQTHANGTPMGSDKVVSSTQAKVSINITDIQIQTDIYNMQDQFENFKASYNGQVIDASELRKEYYDYRFKTDFDHKVLVHPDIEAINTVIDYIPVVGGVKQMAEGLVGTTLTGEKLTDKERVEAFTMGAIFAAVDWFTLGGSGILKKGGQNLVVKVAIQTGTGLAIKAGSDKLVEMGVPSQVVFVGVVLGGVGVGKLKNHFSTKQALSTEALEAAGKGAGGAGNLKELNIGDFTDEIMITKPKNSTVPDKWINKGGKIEIDELGNWKYTNKSGKSVIYKDGYPDFNPYKHPNVDSVPIEIATPKNYPKDYEAANRAAGLGPNSKPPITEIKKPPEGYIWHHVEDGETMILVEKDIHREFTHAGGQSLINGKGK